MKTPWILPVGCLFLGTVLGWLSGRGTSGGEAGVSKDPQVATRTRSVGRDEASKQDGQVKRAAKVAGTEQIVRLPGGSNRVQALIDYYSGLTPGQLEEEALKLENLPMNERMLASFLLFGRWGESDPTAAMAFAGTMGFTGMFVRPTILQSWASVDPAAAARYYTANPREFSMMGMGGGRGPMGGQGGASIIASEWAKQDPAGALAWASSLGGDKSQAMNAVVGEVAKSDPKKAAEMLAAADIPDKAAAFRMVAGHYGAADFAAAQAWIRSLPPEDQAGALAAAIGGLSNTNPQSAVAEVERMEPGDARDRVVAEVVEDLARSDPQAAGNFLKKQQSERALREGMRGLMPAWVAKDPQGALVYAESFEPGGVRDSALQTYVWSNNSSAPADLLKVAESIGDEGDRNRTIGIAAMRWMREDEPAARSYIEQSTTLSDEAKQRILDGRGLWGGGGRGRRGGN